MFPQRPQATQRSRRNSGACSPIQVAKSRLIQKLGPLRGVLIALKILLTKGPDKHRIVLPAMKDSICPVGYLKNK
jgi:hypothetical protein